MTTAPPTRPPQSPPAFDDGDVVAACGTVLPRHVESVWERGRYVEYMLAFGFFKRVQDHYGKPLISSGCFSIYRTDAPLPPLVGGDGLAEATGANATARAALDSSAAMALRVRAILNPFRAAPPV